MASDLEVSEWLRLHDAQIGALQAQMADACRKQTDEVVGGAYLAGWEACLQVLRARGFHKAADAATLPPNDPEGEAAGDSNYVCDGCGDPIKPDEEMVGSDVFSVYAHKRCEKLAQEKAFPKRPESQEAARTLGRYASDPRFAAAVTQRPHIKVDATDDD